MALRETIHDTDIDLFRQELVNLIDLRHELCVLAGKLDWTALERQFGGLYAPGVGRPGHPIRLMVGLQLLKYLRNISDEEVVATWTENPYWQYFCGEQYFCHDLPIDPSLMTGFRQRIGQEGCELILSLTVQTGLTTKTITASSLAVVNVDTTVQDKAVAFPTDARLLNKARIALVKLGAKCGIKLRQPYTFIGQKAFVQSARYAHARQFNRAKAQTKKLRVMLGRVIRDTQRKSGQLQLPAKEQARLGKLLEIAQRIHSQQRVRAEGAPPKIYSVHAPEVECIAKGKAHKQYEFGVKVGLVTTSKESFVLAAKSLPGNPYDGHTLKQCLDQAKRTCGVAASQVFVDKGYKGHGCTTDACQVFISGAKRGITPALNKKLKRRNAIEPVIGHMKSDTRLSRNFLKGELGDAVNALLCAAAHNLRKILAKLRLLCAQWEITWYALLIQIRTQRSLA
ncbi:IS5 family transposase [Janthinobacterium sp.]|uniref:IS5 family transposase n=1 Tax=Janthinobacterium sp. TaxID=1871054 RepID=UPI00293D5D0B|nr:IS5 family transposase [Janthinobacterium sp.]